jgi:hypothetical protein
MKLVWTFNIAKKIDHGSRRFFLFDIVNRVNEVFKICFMYF